MATMPTMPTTAPEVVTLKHGLVVSQLALDLLWSLEDRRFALQALADGTLVVRPRRRLTPADDLAIRRHRVELVTLVRYCTEVIT
jgi:hypothetical protein